MNDAPVQVGSENTYGLLLVRITWRLVPHETLSQIPLVVVPVLSEAIHCKRLRGPVS